MSTVAAIAKGTTDIEALLGADADSLGGMGLISGRKAFQRPIADGVKLLNAIQDVYLDKRITVA
jgi:class I fructose-bisphosphate aldolase